jgi:biotin transport system substrate-specific component
VSAKDTVLVAMFAALTAALGLLPPIPVPFVPVPVTGQTLGIMLSGCVIGARRAALAMLLLLVLLALGLPLLSGGRGGLGVFVGPSAGYLIAWPLAAYCIGAFVSRFGASIGVLFLANCVGGIGLVYVVGVPIMALVLDLSVGNAALAGSVFLPGDLIKAGVASAVAAAVLRAYPTQKNTQA